MEQIDITVTEANLNLPEDQDAVLRLIDAYAADPMGDGEPLSDFARGNLIAGLREHPTTMIFLARRGMEPIGIAVCFRGFSTFAARPLLNIHDFFVMPEHRGTGVSRLLFVAIEKRARELGYCKLTLEVQERNARARSIYAAAGFSEPGGEPEARRTFFLRKLL